MPVLVKRRLTMVVAAIAIAAAVTLPAAPAAAHTELKSTDPAKGSTVTTALATVTLTFEEPVRQRTTEVTVTGPDGISYSDGAARVVDATVQQTVKPLPAGAITVAWKTTAPDGDPISGTFGFTYAPPAQPSATPSPAANSTPGSTAGSTAAATAATDAPRTEPAADKDGNGTLWLIIAAVLVVAALGAGGLWLRRRRAT
jgi:methionine-rich copper-binding protein CopC